MLYYRMSPDYFFCNTAEKTGQQENERLMMTASQMTMLLIQVLGGLAIFVYGMNLMSEGLQRAAGEKMKSILRVFSSNRLIAVFSGASVTAVVQSSSASTVMVIGFINAGLLTLSQAIGIIFGANIGTTVTAQIIAFDISWIVMPAIIAGVVMGFFTKQRITAWGWSFWEWGSWAMN